MLRRLRSSLHRAPGIDTSVFRDLESFCLFIGYPRSGHSLVGSVLDAHPEMTIAHEADVLKLFMKRDYSREQIFQTLVDNAREQAGREKGRTQSGYLYAVPGQWQGRWTRLKVIGDKGGGEASRRLAADPSELRKFAEMIGLPLKVLHVTRNPFDSVARLARVKRRGVRKQTLDEAITRFEALAVANAGVIDTGRFDILTLRHEDFVAEPRSEIRRLCEFLAMPADDEYVEACAGIVWPEPRRTRERIEWSSAQVDRLGAIVDRYDFFAGYSFAGQPQIAG